MDLGCWRLPTFLFSFSSFSLVWAVFGSFLCRPFPGSFGVFQLRPLPRFPGYRLLPLLPFQGQAFLVVFSLFAGFGRSCESDVSELSDCPDLLEEDVELSELSESSDELNSCNSRFCCGLTQEAVAEEEDLE